MIRMQWWRDADWIVRGVFVLFTSRNRRLAGLQKEKT